MNNKRIENQTDILKEFFINHPNQDIPQTMVVDWVTAEWEKRTGKIFRHPGSTLRNLFHRGYLLKSKRGCYHYDPKQSIVRNVPRFSDAQRKQILMRDNHKCVVCGLGKREGEYVYATHLYIDTSMSGNKSGNGITLCGKHKNILLASSKITHISKDIFITLYNKARDKSDQKRINFYQDILRVYEKHKIDDHINWDK